MEYCWYGRRVQNQGERVNRRKSLTSASNTRCLASLSSNVPVVVNAFDDSSKALLKRKRKKKRTSRAPTQKCCCHYGNKRHLFPLSAPTCFGV